MVATEARRVRLGRPFAIIGSHPEYSTIKYPPIHPHCQCSALEVLKPEYGGPAHVAWADPLIQPKPGKDYVPPAGKAVPEPDPAKAKAPLRPAPAPAPAPVEHPEVPDRVPKPGGRPEGPGVPNPLPPDLDLAHLRTLDLHKVEPTWALDPGHGKLSYGGVIVDERGRVLLREPTNHFDGYHWTFAKGKVDAGEHPVDAALREVREETGHSAAVLGLVPGGFQGGTGTNYYFVMRSTGDDPTAMDHETASTRWATPEEARALIAQTTNAKGRARDLAVLDAALARLGKLKADGSANAALKPRPAAPGPSPAPAPRKPRAAKAKAKAKGTTGGAAKGDFPAGPEGLQKVRDLGGSTGAELVKDPATGRLFVRKRGANADHLREECTADSAYRQLGARVPEFQLYETPAGPVKLSAYLEGAKPLAAVLGDPKLGPAAIADLKRHFAADALLGNWDVIGLSADNVLVDPQGHAWRVDNGGSLRYRAQGGVKTAAEWDAYPTELWTMRDRGKNAQTARVFGDLTIREIAGQVEAMAKVKLDLPAAVAPVVAARMGQLKDVARRANTFLDDRFKDGHTDGLCKHMIGLRKAGVRDRMPAALAQDRKGSTTVKDQDGKAFDHLRGRDSLVGDLQKYVDSAGGDYRLVSAWMGGQAGSSWSHPSMALKYFLANARESDPLKGYYWSGGRDDSERAYRDAVAKAGSEEKYRATFQALHAFTHDYLEKADFPLKDAKRGTVRLTRTEKLEVMQSHGLKRGDKGVVMPRGVAESTSIYKTVKVYGSEKTVQDVPIHRVLATYWQERNAGRSDSGFLGDHENEFLAMLDGVPFDYAK